MTNPIRILPAVALRGVTILPGMIVHFDVSRERSVKAVEAAMLKKQQVFLVTQSDASVTAPIQTDLYPIGTLAAIKQVVKLPKGLLRVLVEGQERAQLLDIVTSDPYLECETAICEEEESELPDTVREAMYRGIHALFRAYCMENGKMNQELVNQILNHEELEELMRQVAINLPLDYKKRQQILEALTLSEQYETLGGILEQEIQILQITRDLQKKLKGKIDQNQREYILREQMKMIREELGEDGPSEQADEYERKLEELEASLEVKEKIAKEIRRLRSLHGNASEASVSSGYIETLLNLPWDRRSQDSEDLKEAKRILEEGHYGLKDVKERVMEFLAVRKLTHKGKSPILCLVGPPGTGKTSIAKSVAEALNKKYVRICLGGVRDEAEIRGHRKTYIGAMPGRITIALQQAGVGNPLMLLDEIDKTSSDYKGDTSSALLEVLDPEQNSHFIDHYVELPQDLSEVLFIATANDVSGIPRPLLDRMELIEIAGYTENEKEHIAKEHLIPKQLELNGLKKGQLVIKAPALKKIINLYTKEAGVRSLERRIGTICRKAVRKIMEDGEKQVTVTAKNLTDFLGKERYSYLMKNKEDEVGIARGLAWTQVGGDTLQIEVNVMPGKGEILLTGQLGDVMKESAQAGISYIRSVAKKYEIPESFFQEHDIHVHIPEGAVPKDGPSAGITMTTAMLSAITGKKVRADLAMTGEVTLRGRVLPIGGLKEKLLAAKYAKIHHVLVPKQNRPDIAEMEEEILEGLKLTYVESMGEVLKEAFV